MDVAFQAVNGEVHLRQANGGGVLFQAAEGEPLGGALVVFFDNTRALHEHATGAAGRVEYGAALGIKHVGDQRD